MRQNTFLRNTKPIQLSINQMCFYGGGGGQGTIGGGQGTMVENYSRLILTKTYQQTLVLQNIINLLK